MSKTVISSDKAPAAIGTYSQAIKAGNTVYMSGQIPLDPKTMELVEGFEAQTVQVFENLKAVVLALAVKLFGAFEVFVEQRGIGVLVFEHVPFQKRKAVSGVRSA